MKLLSTLIGTFMLLTPTYSQVNLVPNPSFEDTISCPVNGRVYHCANWMNFGNTPDYNHVCGPGGNAFGVPNNLIGFQYPLSGNAYSDICTFAYGGQFREFIGVQLLQPTVVGHLYYITFYVSPGSPGNGYCLQSNKIGAKFSTVPYDSINLPSINNLAHIYTNTIVSDTSNWTQIQGSFTADSIYNYLIIGNFFDDASTDTSIIASDCYAFAMYYIDDIFVNDLVNFQELIFEDKKSKIITSNGKIKYLGHLENIKSIYIYDYHGRLLFENHEILNNDEIYHLTTNGIYLVKILEKTGYHSIKIIIH